MLFNLASIDPNQSKFSCYLSAYPHGLRVKREISNFTLTTCCEVARLGVKTLISIRYDGVNWGISRRANDEGMSHTNFFLQRFFLSDFQFLEVSRALFSKRSYIIHPCVNHNILPFIVIYFAFFFSKKHYKRRRI